MCGAWAQGQAHARHTEAILARIGTCAKLTGVSAAHHGRLDGGGDPRGLRGDAIALETRIITVADIFDAISAEQPYRSAVPVPQTLEIMAGTAGNAIDALRFEALKVAVGQQDIVVPGDATRRRRARRVRTPGSRLLQSPAIPPCGPGTASRR